MSEKDKEIKKLKEQLKAKQEECRRCRKDIIKYVRTHNKIA